MISASEYGPECKRLNIGARAGGALHFNYLHVGLLRRVGVPDIVCAPRSPPRPIAAINNNRRWFWASLDRHIQRRTPSLHHSSRKSHCLCAAFACGGNLGPGVWFGLRFRLGSDCVSVSVEVPIGVCFELVQLPPHLLECQRSHFPLQLLGALVLASFSCFCNTLSGKAGHPR